MLDIFSWTHIVILLGVALIFVGPQELPRLMHMLGKWAGKARAMAVSVAEGAAGRWSVIRMRR